MEKLLTVIVPTYNMEMYLDKCLTSLIVGEPECEMMQKLEVLVINDGSTDKSSEIAHGYKSRYPYTFKVVDKSNGNYGSCINVALPIATGKYVKILDADDWFDTDVFKEYLTWLQDKDVDAVFTDHWQIQNDEKKEVRLEGVQPNCELCFNDYFVKLQSISMHSVTYNLKVFKGLGYHQTEGIFYTDREWIYLPMSVVKTFVYYPRTLYCYLRGRAGQTMDPVVCRENFLMRIEVMFAYIGIYEKCRENGGFYNGNSVNMDYLRCMSEARAMSLYALMLARIKEDSYKSHISYAEQRLRKEYPNFYKKMDVVKYPCWSISYPHVSFCVVHTWRKYGKIIAQMQLWLANHYLGLYNRLNSLKRKF